jgi:toxin ParE1/3/4
MNNSGLGAEFMAAVDARLQQVQAGPNQFPSARGLIRLAIVHRFPYGIFFVAHSEFINVIAVMHHARDPKHWRRRAHLIEANPRSHRESASLGGSHNV